MRPALATPLMRVSSYVLMAGALLLLMVEGLLPGLLFACLGFLVTRWVAQQLAYMPRRLRLRSVPNATPRLPRWAQVLAAALVMVAPLVLLMLGLAVLFLLVRLPEEVDRVDDAVDDAFIVRACAGTPLEAASREVAGAPSWSSTTPWQITLENAGRSNSAPASTCRV